MPPERELQYIRTTNWYKNLLQHMEEDRQYRLERLADCNASTDEIRRQQGYLAAMRDLYNYITGENKEE